jgi:zinc transport system ATP-binding protein
MTVPALRVHDLSVSLSGRPVVRRVDLAVRPGEFVTLLGANGSGKSTLVRACVGLLPWTSGSVELFGDPLAAFEAWHRVGYVPQRSGAASGVPATVAEVVGTGRLARRQRFGWPRSDDRRAVRTRLEQVGLGDRASDAVAQLSGGQQQRVMIARALACDPELLVLDEPVAGVDAASQEVLAGVLAELVRGGCGVLLVAHELGPLAPLVDRAVVLRGGRVAYDGPVHQLTDGEADAAHAHAHAHGEAPAPRTGLPPEGPWR